MTTTLDGRESLYQYLGGFDAGDVGAAVVYAGNQEFVPGTFEPAGTASGLMITHLSALNPHNQYLLASSFNPAAFDAAGAAAAVAASLTTHAALTTGAHGMTAFGAGLVAAANAPDARGLLALGTMATQAASAYAALETTNTFALTQTFTSGLSLASSFINHLGGVDVPILKLRGGNAIIWGGGSEAIRFVRSVEITAGGSLGGVSFAINDGSGGQYLKLEGGNNYGLYFSLRSGSPSWDTSIQRLSAAVLKVGNSGTGYGALAVETLRVNSSVVNANTPSGATARAMPIYDVAGALLGYCPIYASQW